MKTMHQRFTNCILGLAIITGVSDTALANTIRVPVDQPTIQDGLNAAGFGDTVLVAPGTYYENILWPDVNGIKLLGFGRDSTIIDGNNAGSVIRFESNDIIDNSTVLDGFTITNGNAQPPYPESAGGGIYLFYADPILSNLTVRGNFADDFGGGIFCWGGTPLLSRVVIDNNTAIAYAGFDCYGCTAILDHVTMTRNDPGGLYVETGSHPLMSNSISAFNSLYGIQVHGTSFQPTSMDLGYTDAYDAIQLIGYASVNQLGGNIDVDPLFVDRFGGDFHLTSASPCIDAGDPAYPMDPDCTLTEMGAFYYQQIRLHVTPLSLDFGLLDVGDDSTGVITLQNSGDEPIPVDDISHGIQDFIVDTTGLGGQVDAHSIFALTVTFAPSAIGTYSDNLVIVAQQDGSDTVLVTLDGEADVIPMIPEGLVVLLGSQDSIDLRWQPVTHTISGQPISVQYVIYGATSQGDQFQPFGFTSDTSFVHPNIINSQASYFYYVEALPEGILSTSDVIEPSRAQLK